MKSGCSRLRTSRPVKIFANTELKALLKVLNADPATVGKLYSVRRKLSRIPTDKKDNKKSVYHILKVA